jgi:sodium pump decarboxylase gamma subunit
MPVNLINALLITVIGMGLVFAAILFLWGLMAALVKIAGKWSKEESAESPAESDASKNRKRLAAAIAVSVALAHQADLNEPHDFPLPPTALVSAWQAVMRTKMHSKRGIIR